MNALKALCYDEEEIQEIKRALPAKIRKNNSWMQAIKRRAEKRQLPLDTAVVHEANFVVDHQPEVFLPALKDSIPLKESTKARLHLQTKAKKQEISK